MGPCDVLVGAPVVPDLSGSFDPGGLPLLNALWDLDGDFQDHLGVGPIDPATFTAKICGGECVPGVDKVIRPRVYSTSSSSSTSTSTSIDPTTSTGGVVHRPPIPDGPGSARSWLHRVRLVSRSSSWLESRCDV
ncbi:MAG: hypothetical protein ACXWB2_17445 [Acidimicrobiales bacterium]